MFHSPTISDGRPFCLRIFAYLRSLPQQTFPQLLVASSRSGKPMLYLPQRSTSTLWRRAHGKPLRLDKVAKQQYLNLLFTLLLLPPFLP